MEQLFNNGIVFTTSCLDATLDDDLIDVNGSLVSRCFHSVIASPCLSNVLWINFNAETMQKKQQRELKGFQSNDNNQSSDYSA